MTEVESVNSQSTGATKLPRRDRIVLPLLGLLTLCVIAGSTELVTKLLFKESAPFIPTCLEPVDPEYGARAIPNSACSDKKFESERVEYRFNSCGHRMDIDCGPKPPGTYRIVMTGSSFAMGHLVDREKTFAALLPIEISRQIGRRVELYNESIVSVGPHAIALRMNEVLTAEPDMILWILTPFDVKSEIPTTATVNPDRESSGALARAWFRIKATLAQRSLSDAGSDLYQRAIQGIRETPTATLLLHYLELSESQYVKSYLRSGDDAGFLRTTPSKEWQDRLSRLAADTSEIARQAKARGIPLVATLVPSRAQAAMISMKEWPAGYDPYSLNRQLRSIIVSHGGTYIDILPAYRNIPDSGRGYFPVDGHPNAYGHAVISRALTTGLTEGAVAELGESASSRTATENGR
jgi:hypothetical protein